MDEYRRTAGVGVGVGMGVTESVESEGGREETTALLQGAEGTTDSTARTVTVATSGVRVGGAEAVAEVPVIPSSSSLLIDRQRADRLGVFLRRAHLKTASAIAARGVEMRRLEQPTMTTNLTPATIEQSQPQTQPPQYHQHNSHLQSQPLPVLSLSQPPSSPSSSKFSTIIYRWLQQMYAIILKNITFQAKQRRANIGFVLFLLVIIVVFYVLALIFSGVYSKS